MENSLLERNPFPTQGTISLEGRQPETAINGSTKILPTLETDAVSTILRLSQNYLIRFRPSEKNQVQDRNIGEVVGLRGEHGSGKTHAIFFLITKVPGEDSKKRRKLHFYAKAETVDFLEVYRKLVGQVPFASFRDLGFSFLNVVASEQIQKDWKERDEDLRLTEKLKNDPQRVYQLFQEHLFQTYLIEEGAVQGNQAEEIKRTAQENKDFQRAISYLTSSDAEMSDLSYNWFLGQDINVDDNVDNTKKLGVSGSINSDRMAVLALQVLVRLSTRINEPIIIYIDQIEKLVLDKDSRIVERNIGSLQSLVEIIPRQNGMLMLSGNEEAWKAFPLDFRQRFGNNIVKFPILTLEEAKQLIKLYLTPPGQPFERECSEEDLKSFTIEAVGQIYYYSNGNHRRLLQSCSAVYDAFLEKNAEKLTEEKIEPTLVAETLRRGSLPFVDKETVVTEIKKLWREKSLQFKTGTFQEGSSNDFTVLINKQPRLFIVISKAIFYLDEVEKSLEHLNLVQNRSKLKSQALNVLVVFGYVSPEITKAVRKVVDELIVYKPETFRTLFGDLLERVLTIPQLPEKKEVDDHYLQELKSELQELRRYRQEEFSILESRFTELMKQQATERQAKQHEEAKRIWAEERRSLEDKIQKTRAERRMQELQELEHLRTKGENDYRNQIFAKTIVLGISVFVLTWITELLYIELRIQSSYFFKDFLLEFAGQKSLYPGTLYIALITVFIVVIFSILWQLSFFGSSLRRELLSSVASDNDLARLARAYLGSKSKSFYSSDAPLLFPWFYLSLPWFYWSHRLSRFFKYFTIGIFIAIVGLFGLTLEHGYMSSSSYLLLLLFIITLLPFVYGWLFKPRFINYRCLLCDQNPQVRYVGVLAASQARDFNRMLTQFSSERSSIVRRLIAKQLAEKWDKKIVNLLDNFPEIVNIPEVAYIVEESARRELIPERWMLDLPTPLITLSALSGKFSEKEKIQMIEDLSSRSLPLSLALEIALASSRESVRLLFPIFGHLAEAFKIGLDRWSLKFTENGSRTPLYELSESRVTAAIKELSPFQEGGLGTYDELRNIHKIDQYYLFFCQFRFLMEQDLL